MVQPPSYLDQRAVAIPGCLCIKVIMVIDGGEAGYYRLQGSTMFLNLFHTSDQTLNSSAVWQMRRPAKNRDVVLAHFLQGCKHNLVIHFWGCEGKREKEEETAE